MGSVHLRALGLVMLLPSVVSAQSWCSAGERTYFYCALGVKRVSVCGAAPTSSVPGHLRYVIGRDRKNPELAFPVAGANPAEVFRFGAEGRSAKGGIWNLQFRRGAYTYTVYRFRHAFEKQSAGVAVPKPTGGFTYSRCAEGGLVDDLAELEIFHLPPLAHNEIVESPE
jgi:hypothetical protein